MNEQIEHFFFILSIFQVAVSLFNIAILVCMYKTLLIQLSFVDWFLLIAS